MGRNHVADIPLTERFWAKVEKTDTCWLWKGHLSNGYGRFRISTNGIFTGPHRWSYEQTHGPIADGLTIDHLCRVRNCVNPEHLEAVPSRVNTLRGASVTASNARKTTCVNGHPLDEANTGVQLNNTGTGRYCRTCKRNRCAARRRAARGTT